MKRIIYIICTMLTLGGAASSCDFLEVVPPKTMDIPDTVKDKNRTIGFLYSCYEGVTAIYMQKLVRSFMTSTDEFGLPNSWGVVSQQYAWGMVNPGQIYNSVWDQCYKCIGRTNNLLQLLDQYTPAYSSEEDIARWKAECHFLLGFYHFILLEAYGPVPIIDHFYPSTTDKSEFPGRSHFDYCVTRVCQWFDQACEEGLPDYMEDTAEIGRATTAAAKALKARALLYAASPFWNGEAPLAFKEWKNKNYETPGYGKELISSTFDPQKWEKAKEACIEAIDWATVQGNRTLYLLEDAESRRKAEGVSLPDIPGASEDVKRYASLMRYLGCTTETDGNKEVIFGSAYPTYSVNDKYLDWENTALPHAVTIYNGAPTGGRSGISPFLYTVEHFYTANGKLPKDDKTFAAESDWFASAGLTRSEIINLNAMREPRFYAWIAFDGAEYGSKLANGKPLIVNMRDKDKQGYNPSKDNDLNITGFLSTKFILPNLTWNASSNGTNTKTVPFPVVRLGELYLDLAECYAALGDAGKALDNLNVIRERAGIPKLETSDISSSMSLMDWVRNERFIELWGEGHRYFDLRRWCLAPQHLKAGAREGLNFTVVNPSFEELNQRTKITSQPFQWNDRMYLIPIATTEVDSNPQLVQAPLY